MNITIAKSIIYLLIVGGNTSQATEVVTLNPGCVQGDNIVFMIKHTNAVATGLRWSFFLGGELTARGPLLPSGNLYYAPASAAGLFIPVVKIMNSNVVDIIEASSVTIAPKSSNNVGSGSMMYGPFIGMFISLITLLLKGIHDRYLAERPIKVRVKLFLNQLIAFLRGNCVRWEYDRGLDVSNVSNPDVYQAHLFLVDTDEIIRTGVTIDTISRSNTLKHAVHLREKL